MTWTYSNTDLSTDLAKVRLYCGDTNVDKPLLTDEEIDVHLSGRSDLYNVAADCCQTIIGQLAREVDRQGVGVTTTRSQQIMHYQDLEKRLRAKAKLFVRPHATGQSESDRSSYATDTDLAQPIFTRDRGENNT